MTYNCGTKMSVKIKVVLADDHSLMREAIATLIEQNGCEVVAQAESYHTLEKIFSRLQFDLLISDCRMDGQGPLNFLKFVKRFHPDCKIIYLTGLESGMLFQQLLAEGVHGLVSKKGEVSEVVAALDKVMYGETYISDAFKDEIDTATILTVTEYQVLELIVQGLSNKLIAEQLNKSAGTINTHRVHIMQKLDVHTVVDLVHHCRKNGLFDS